LWCNAFYLAKVTGLFKNCIAPQGSQRTSATRIAATTPELTVEILNSVF